MMQIFTDNPLAPGDKDAFGFATYAEILEKLIEQTTSLPFSIGVFGPWGSGKTSFMRLLQSALMAQNIPTIWFNPWKYDQKEDLWHALILTILSEIARTEKDGEVQKKILDLAKTTGLMALRKTVTALTSGAITGEDIDSIAKIFDKTDIEYYRNINYFEADFSSVVKHYCHNDKLVIFIDDLDRCLPENAITILESFKLFLNNEYCVFVAGMDHNIVEEGIRHRYNGKISLNGRDYLDKIIQIPFFLPRVSYEKLRDSLPTDPTFSEEIWSIIQLAMEGNPRKTRRFINSFSLAQRFLNEPDKILQQRMQTGSLKALPQKTQNIYLAQILVFEMNFPDFYYHLQHNPGDWKYIVEEIVDMDNGETRERTLNKNAQLKIFWEDSAFKTFMNQTSARTGRYPSAPTEEVVTLLLRAINLVTEV